LKFKNLIKKRLKTRKCLVCDRTFQTFSENHICNTCHKRHAKLFESCPVGNLEGFIYDVDPPLDRAEDSKNPDPGDGGDDREWL
jgi:hypothetical protein